MRTLLLIVPTAISVLSYGKGIAQVIAEDTGLPVLINVNEELYKK